MIGLRPCHAALRQAQCDNIEVQTGLRQAQTDKGRDIAEPFLWLLGVCQNRAGFSLLFFINTFFIFNVFLPLE